MGRKERELKAKEMQIIGDMQAEFEKKLEIKLREKEKEAREELNKKFKSLLKI